MALGFLKGFMRRWADRLGPDDLQARLAQVTPPMGSDLGTDAVGFDPEFVHEAIAPALWLYRHYFRVEARGLEHLPEGPSLVIANHSGQLPLDGVMIGLAALLEADPPRYLRAMAEFWVPTLPYVSIFFSRIGQLVGTPENARRLLDQGEAVLVFPEGVRGINKPITQAYQLQRFGLGFMRLALEAKVPIVPVAVVGAEEQYVSLANLEGLGRRLGMPALPVVPQLLVPALGLLPLPTRYHVEFGAPLTFTGLPDEEDAEVEAKVRQVTAALEGMLREGLARRRSIFR